MAKTPKPPERGRLVQCEAVKLLGSRSRRLGGLRGSRRCLRWSRCGCCSFGLWRFLLLLFARRQNGVQGSSFHAGHELNNAGLADILNQPVDDSVAQLAVRHLAATEAQAGLHLVALTQKTNGLVLLRLVVMLVHRNGELHFLDDDDLLLLAGGAITLFLFVQEAPVILDSADWGDSVGRDFNQIKPALPGDLQGLKGRQNSKLFAVLVNYADFACPDTVVDANKGLCCSFIECDGAPPEVPRRGLASANLKRRRQANAPIEYSIGAFALTAAS